MFYNIYKDLCDKKGVKPYTAAREMGFGRSNVGQWEKGSTPRRAALETIAAYFGVSVSYLLTGEKKSPPPEVGGGREDRLLQAWRSLTPERQERFLALLEDLAAQ